MKSSLLTYSDVCITSLNKSAEWLPEFLHAYTYLVAVDTPTAAFRSLNRNSTEYGTLFGTSVELRPKEVLCTVVNDDMFSARLRAELYRELYGSYQKALQRALLSEPNIVSEKPFLLAVFRELTAESVHSPGVHTQTVEVSMFYQLVGTTALKDMVSECKKCKRVLSCYTERPLQCGDTCAILENLKRK